MTLFTIGFTKKSASDFFTRVTQSGATTLIDVRLNNTSQLAGFAKRDDLQYFLKTICGIGYQHMPQLAPTKEILKRYRQNKSWDQYQQDFLQLMADRQIEQIDPALINHACLLCSEDKPDHCHRTLVAEYLKAKWGNLDLVHL